VSLDGSRHEPYAMLALRYEQSAQYDKALDYRAKAATLVPPNLRPQAAEAGAQPPRDAVTPDLDPSEVPRKMFGRPELAIWPFELLVLSSAATLSVLASKDLSVVLD